MDILNEVVKHNPKVIVLFPGLANTINMALDRINQLEYDGEVYTAHNLDELIEYVAEFAHEDYLFIGGNGQEIIITIQERLEELCKVCN